MDNHTIHPDWRLTSDHAPLTIVIPIMEEHIQTKKCTIVKNSDEEHTFVKELTKKHLGKIFKNHQHYGAF